MACHSRGNAGVWGGRDSVAPLFLLRITLGHRRIRRTLVRLSSFNDAAAYTRVSSTAK